MLKIASLALLQLAAATAAFADAAPATATGQPRGNALTAFFPLVIFVLIFYFMIMRPQKKRKKTHDNLINSLGRGDKIITAGGFFGIIREVKDDSVIIELAEGVRARVLKGSISTKVTAAASPEKKVESNKAAPEAPKAEEPAAAEKPADKA